LYFVIKKRRIEMKRRIIGITISIFALSLISNQAMADLLLWKLVASCPPGQKEVKVEMSYSTPGWPNYTASGHVPDRLKQTNVLYACGSACKAQTLASSIPWKQTSNKCTCYPSGKEAVNGHCEDPKDIYSKCWATAEAAFAYDCDQMAYQKICVSPTCVEEKPESYLGGEPSMPCAELSPPSTAQKCLNEQPEVIYYTEGQTKEDNPNKQADVKALQETQSKQDSSNDVPETGGCTISPGAMNSSLLGFLFVIGGLSMFISRRRRG
jgi:hypothetical protein